MMMMNPRLMGQFVMGNQNQPFQRAPHMQNMMQRHGHVNIQGNAPYPRRPGNYMRGNINNSGRGGGNMNRHPNRGHMLPGLPLSAPPVQQHMNQNQPMPSQNVGMAHQRPAPQNNMAMQPLQPPQ